ncbi:MAG: hypothetical protein F4024_19945 [Gammaproteobacteria bacterium]|nr:hypothetical protein [Gammaproteobacteria bacterium]
MKIQFTKLLPRLLLGVIAALGGLPNGSLAQDRGFYLGLAASAERFDASIRKVVDNRQPGNQTPSQGQVFHDRDSGDGTATGLGAAAGYRLPLNGDGLHLSAEFNLTWHSGKAKGLLAGVRNPQARAEYQADQGQPMPEFGDRGWAQAGESWPDAWRFKKDWSYGATLRLGGRPEFLGALIGQNAELYALAGAQRTETKTINRYLGCLAPPTPSLPTPCPTAADFTAGISRFSKARTAWTLGLGVGKPIGRRTLLQVEAYYADYGRKTLTEFTTPPLVTQARGAGAVGLRLRLLNYL